MFRQISCMSIPADSRPGESATRRDAVLVNQFRQQHRAMSNIFPSSRSVSSRPSVFANGIRLCASAILYCVATLVSLNLVGESRHGECEHGCATKATTKASVDVGVQALLHTLGRRQLVQSSHRVHLQGHQPHTTSAHSATQRLSTHTQRQVHSCSTLSNRASTKGSEANSPNWRLATRLSSFHFLYLGFCNAP